MEPVYKALSLKKTSGDIGIEIEVETNREVLLDKEYDYWGIEEDHSLRGYSAEFVTKGPIKIDNIEVVLSELKQSLDQNSIQILNSFRAGVHIHVNCQHMTLDQIGTFAAVYYCLDHVLTKFCGPTREGNFFCLRLNDAEAPLFYLLKSLRDGKFESLKTDMLRYATLNFRSLFKHGSLEFRAMATRPDLSKINEWAKILYNIREYSLSLDTRPTIAQDISFLGPETWAEKVIGTDLIKHIEYEGYGKDILKNMRQVQELIYFEMVGHNETSE